ncbi:urea amidolyase associated protein UAAP1 [Streptomyces sp. NBC_01803]|uniref:urea amidolyase associated protein UAAP1 n=1 Tax=Streptomyces sp. NBC_01803 TaxID=2975946 RepID=UPI002DDC1E47|nr:urea amidolyase associated protein UAAP1 [Streptomyces sp. NBC_01803]WSA42905.1 DUF1989 domain-containing protein [Streptomyces sp. NBC_01803]
MTTPAPASGPPGAASPAGSATATTYAARDHARTQAGTRVTAMPTVPATDWPTPPPGVPTADVRWAETIGGGNHSQRVLARGTALRLTDPDGDACANLLLHVADRPWERLNVADTVKVQWNAYLGAHQLLLSDQGRVLASVTADSSRTHDALCGASTLARNTARYGDGAAHGPSPAGRELLKLAAARHDLGPRDLPPALTLFKGVRVRPDGSLEWTGSAGPGAFVTLRAELPLIVLIANAAHPLDPRPAYTCAPLEVLAWRDRPTAPGDPLWEATPEGRRAFLNTADHLAARGAA